MPNFLSGANDLLTTIFNHAEDLVLSMPGSFLPPAENKTSPLRRPVDSSSRRTATNSSPARPTEAAKKPLDTFLEGTFGSEIIIPDDETPQTSSKNTRSQVRRSRAHGNESESRGDMSYNTSFKKPFIVSTNNTPVSEAKGRSSLLASSRPARNGEPPLKKPRLDSDRPLSNSTKSPTRASLRLPPNNHSLPSSSKQTHVMHLDQRSLSGSTAQERSSAPPPMRALGRRISIDSDQSRPAKDIKQHDVNGATPTTLSKTRIDQTDSQDSRRHQKRPSKSKTNSSHATPPSKIVKRYDESPDVLQGDSTVEENPKGRRPLQELIAPVSAPPTKWDQTFKLKTFVCEPESQDKGWHLSFSKTRQELDFGLQSSDGSHYILLLRSITDITVPEDEEVNIIRLRASSCPLGTKLYLEFNSLKDRTDFHLAILGASSNIDGLSKPSDWLQRALGGQRIVNGEERVRRSVQNDSVPRSEIISMEHGAHETPASTSTARQRKIDNLDKPQRSPVPEDRATSKTQDVRINTSSALQSSRPVRQTRSSVTDVTYTPQIEKPNPIPRRKGPQWKRSLVYPPDGKRKETVTWDDLAGLEDDAFLNDSLIGLFLRYIQEHCQQENLSKMHFFNSFFFEALTRNVDKKKNQVINYSSVASWTKHINLFTRDFVVVPVNENLHWYIMIICNLHGLAKQKSALSEAELDGEKLDDVEIRALVQDDKVILQSDVVDTDNFDTGDRASSHNTPMKYGRRKKVPPRRKYDVDRPIIITLDSFEIPRGQTASALKHYLIEEAKKHDLELDKEDIQGMTAKGIPTQSNFSDCGLYMCLYMEQFMRDPYAFVKCILQRETNSLQWPKKIESSELRDRYHAMLQEMYRAQKEKRPPELPQVGGILIDMANKEVEPDTVYKDRSANGARSMSPQSVRAGVENYKLYRADVENSFLNEIDGVEDNSSLLVQSAPRPRQESSGSITEAVTIDDSSHDRRFAHKSSPYFAPDSAKAGHTLAKSASPVISSYFQTKHRNSEQSTSRVGQLSPVRSTRQTSSPTRKRGSQHSVIDLSSPVKQRASADEACLDPASSSKRARAERPPSEIDDQVLELPKLEKFLRAQNNKRNSEDGIHAQAVKEDGEEPFEGFDDQPGEQLNSTLAADIATHSPPKNRFRRDQDRREREYVRIDADHSQDRLSYVPETPHGDSQDLDGDTDMLLD